eukprot:Hpha_TRINITY_DN23316_c0_g1::TRINITY_DN23316_c0_g1_i1::g.96875::m.96875
MAMRMPLEEEEAIATDAPKAGKGRQASWLLFTTILAVIAVVEFAILMFAVRRSDEQTDNFETLYTEFFETARYIDLTHSFGPGTPLWPGFGGVQVGAGKAGKNIEGFVQSGEEFTYAKQGFVSTQYSLSTDQLGTQLDPPSHWNEYGATMSDLPASFTLRPLVIINIQDKVKDNATYAAQPSDVLDHEEVHGTIPKGSVVFIRSDWSLNSDWGIDKDTAPLAESSPFPGVALTTLKLLHQERGILMHGHEPLDTGNTANLEAEGWLMHNNYAQAEGVTNLHLVPQRSCLVSIGFAKPLGGTGGYARYVAICPPRSTRYGVSVEEAPGAPLPQSEYPLRRNGGGIMRPDPTATPTKYCESPFALGCSDGKLVK